MKKVAIIIIVVFFWGGNILSQENSNETLNYSKTTNLNHYIKISPFNLLEFEPSLMLGYSYPVNKGKAQLQHEIGYVFINNSYFFNYDENITFNGLKIRNNYRKYFETNSNKADSLKNPNNRLYYGLDLMYKYCQYTEYDVNYWVSGQFTQIIDLTNQKHVGAAHFIFGVETNFIKNNSSILDFYLGLGLRYKSMNTLYDGKKNTILESEIGQSNRLWYDDFSTPMFLSIMAGVKIGFGL